MFLMHEYVRAILDLEDALGFDVGGVVLGKFLAPLIALLCTHVTLVKHMRRVDRGMREHSVCVPVAHVRLLVGRNALDRDAHGHGERRAVLQKFDLRS